MGAAPMAVGADAAWLADGVAMRRGTLSPQHRPARHTHDYHAVTVLLSSPGRSWWWFGTDQPRSVRPAAGDVFVCPAHALAAVRTDRPFEAVTLCLSTAYLSRTAESLPGVRAGDVRPAVMRDDSFVRHLVLSLADEAGRVRAGRPLLAASLASAVGVHLLREYAVAGRPDPRPARLADGEVARVRRHVEAHLAGDLSLAALAAVVGRSRFHFARLFKAATGETPHRYVVRRRVERARELLAVGERAAEVALAVGFAGQSHLAHHVRRAFGRTPGELAGG